MRASIRRVAGVSSMTVANALNNQTDQMTDETLRRVVETIHKLNYVPVRTATQNRRVTIATPFEQIGVAAVDAIIALQQHYDGAAVSRILRGSLVNKDSVSRI